MIKVLAWKQKEKNINEKSKSSDDFICLKTNWKFKNYHLASKKYKVTFKWEKSQLDQ